MKDQEIEALIEVLGTTQDEYTRLLAAESLGKIDPGNPMAIEALIEVLGTTQDEYTRLLAAESLVKIGTGNPKAIEALIEVLGKTQNHNTRLLAAESLGKIDPGNPKAIEALIEVLGTTQNHNTRLLAAESLGKIDLGNPKAIEALIEVLGTTQYQNTRRQAAESLGKIGTGNPMAIEALIQLLGTTQYQNTWRQAAESLGKIGTGNPKAIEALIQLLGTTQHEYTRRQAAESLGKIGMGNPKAIEALIEVLVTTQDEYTRLLAAESLGKIGTGNPKVIEALIEVLATTQDDDIRRQAAESLEKIDPGNPKVIETLIQLLTTTQNEFTSWQVAERLGTIDPGNPKAIEALIQLLGTTQNEYIRWQAAESLGKIGTGNPMAIRALIQLLATTQDEYTRRQAAESLGKIGTGNPMAIEALIQLLSTTQNQNTRSQAAESLGKIDPGNPMAIKALIQLLSTTQNEKIHMQAAESLGKIDPGNPKAIEALIEVLRTSRKVPARQQAAYCLEKIGISNLKAIAGLRELLRTHQNPYTRQLVTEVLEKITPLTQEQTQQVEDDLLLFLQVTRVKESVDQYFSVNNYKKAKFCYHRIVACLDRLQEGRDIITRRSLMKSYLDIYQRIVSFSIKTGDLNSVFFYTEIFRNRYLVERIAQQDAPLPHTVTAELSAQIEQAKQAEKRTLQNYTDGISRNLDEQQLEQLERKWEEAKTTLQNRYTQVAVDEPEFIAKTNVSPLSFQQIQALLSSDTAILEFFFTANKLVTILILPGAETPRIPESLTLELKSQSPETLAKAWIFDITAKTTSKKTEEIDATVQAISENIHQISDCLKFQNLLNSISSKIQHLIVVPHKYLHLFPLHSLWVNNHQRLIDRFAVSYFPSLQVWKICQNRQRSRNSLIGIENPTQDKDLIFAKAEVASISQHKYFIQSQFLKGKQASKSEVLQSATHHHCFHFSGHAEYNFENPLDSYLMLSENSDENLTLSTIFADMHMPQADLVTLSACCTGVVDAFQPTEEHLGLATGFLLAGAKAVIGSLWKVNSISTAFLFDEFYRQLDETHNKAVALKNAQNWLRRCTADQLRERANTWDLSKLEPKEQFRLERALKRLKGIPFETPYYWAAFILTGC